VCIRYRGDVSTEPLSSNDRGIFTEPLPSNDKVIFTEPSPSNNKGDNRQQRDLISLLYFFQNKESRLQRGLEIGHPCLTSWFVISYLELTDRPAPAS
jgi:hypothetical protein